MQGWRVVLVLSIGGSLGVNARYWLGVAIARWVGVAFPWGTLFINVSGAFAIGLLAVLLSRWMPHPELRLLVVVGFLGGYTTFSSYAAEAMALWERGGRGEAAAYVVGSVAAGIVAVVLGTVAGRMINHHVAAWPDSAATPRTDETAAVRRIAEPARRHADGEAVSKEAHGRGSRGDN